VGARSSVFQSLPGGMICFGTPAVPVKPRTMSSDDGHSTTFYEVEAPAVSARS